MTSPHESHFQHLGATSGSSGSPSLPQAPDLPSSFSSVVGSPHPDVSLSSHSAATVSRAVSSLYAEDAGSGSSISVPMDITPSQSMGVAPMDMLTSAAPHDSTSVDGVISSYHSSHSDSFNGEAGPDVSRPAQSSPANTSVSSYPSHASSPAIPGLNPNFVATSSSIASALDNMAVPTGRGRSDSSASPSHFLAASSASSGPSSGQASSLQFPPSESETRPSVDKEESPEVPGGPHLMVVGDMLKK